MVVHLPFVLFALSAIFFAIWTWKAGVNRQRTPWTFAVGGMGVGCALSFVASLFASIP